MSGGVVWFYRRTPLLWSRGIERAHAYELAGVPRSEPERTKRVALFLGLVASAATAGGAVLIRYDDDVGKYSRLKLARSTFSAFAQNRCFLLIERVFGRVVPVALEPRPSR